ncbi:MAG TPA: hypothetical protein VK716_04005 [Terracidiphilus sp.]|jgi:hypothetical protein|nr:hypothetical protein [Terracidiphilus sp.]
MKGARQIAFAAVLFAFAKYAAAQEFPASDYLTPQQMNESGHVVVGNRSLPYLIRRLPLNAFPQLPDVVAAELRRRSCLIPQTYESHQPENVVRASLERPGSVDWAVLCSVQGTVSLLVFFGSAPEKPVTLVAVPETERLQDHDLTGTLGFNWGIDPASPQRVHDAQIGLSRRPPPPDHDALADSVVDARTVYHFYSRGKWSLLDMPVD